MNIELENLTIIPDIKKRLIAIENLLSVSTDKRWLNTKELALYLGYSVESVHKMVHKGELIPGVHYHKKFKKLLFDKQVIDRWVMGIQTSGDMTDMGNVVNSTIENIMASVS